MNISIYFFTFGFLLFTFFSFSSSGTFAKGQEHYRSQPLSTYTDISVIDELVSVEIDKDAFHLFTHGRSGELLIQGFWMNQNEIANWLHHNNLLEGKSHLNIYGCNFAKGKKGKQAVQYFEEELGVTIAVSDDITGIDVGWELEIGDTSASISLPSFNSNLQCPLAI